MLGQVPRPIGSIALVATLVVSGVGVTVPAGTARAADCLTAPNSAAPQRSHWYYRIDRANERKCWYLRVPVQPGATSGCAGYRGTAASLHSMLAPPRPISGGDPMVDRHGDGAARLPQIKKLAVKPGPASIITPTTRRPAREAIGKGIPHRQFYDAAQASTFSQQTSGDWIGVAALPTVADPVNRWLRSAAGARCKPAHAGAGMLHPDLKPSSDIDDAKTLPGWLADQQSPLCPS